MRAVDDIVKRVGRLTPQERRRLLKALEQFDGTADGGKGRSPAPSARDEAFARWLARAGSIQSGLGDVSTEKYKHLGEVYADKR